MSPHLSFYYPRYGYASHSIISRNGIEGLSILGALSYFKNLGCYKWGFIVFLTYPCRAVYSFVKNIISSSIPSEIFCPIIGSYSIIMTRLHIGWAWANECLKNKTMNQKQSPSVIFSKHNLIISIIVRCFLDGMWNVKGLLGMAYNLETSYISKIANLI